MATQQAPDSFTTERLLARKMGVDDYDDLCRMHSDPRVMATLGGVRSDVETRRFLEEKMAHWQRYGFGYWVFRHTASTRFVGRGGIQHIEVGGNREIEIGYSLLADFWGQGLATEMASALVAICLDVLDLAEIVCFTLTDNLASQRVMQKAGFEYERAILHQGEPHVLCRLRRDAIGSTRHG